MFFFAPAIGKTAMVVWANPEDKRLVSYAEFVEGDTNQERLSKLFEGSKVKDFSAREIAMGPQPG